MQFAFLRKSMEYGEKKRIHEVSLWRAVILQTILDCLTQSKRTENIKARKEAIAWFDELNEDFRTVCRFADLESTFVIKCVKHALVNQHLWRRTCDIGKGAQFLTGKFYSTERASWYS